MPDLGKYALTVLSAYGASSLLILALVLQSLWKGRRMKRRLDEIEARAGEVSA